MLDEHINAYYYNNSVRKYKLKIFEPDNETVVLIDTLKDIYIKEQESPKDTHEIFKKNVFGNKTTIGTMNNKSSIITLNHKTLQGQFIISCTSNWKTYNYSTFRVIEFNWSLVMINEDDKAHILSNNYTKKIFN